MSRKKETARIDIYARITDRIVADLENGVRPWIKPWSARNMTGRVSRRSGTTVRPTRAQCPAFMVGKRRLRVFLGDLDDPPSGRAS